VFTIGRRAEAWTPGPRRLDRSHHPDHDARFRLHQVHERPAAGADPTPIYK
jgi:hypothetical protein